MSSHCYILCLKDQAKIIEEEFKITINIKKLKI